MADVSTMSQESAEEEEISKRIAKVDFDDEDDEDDDDEQAMKQLQFPNDDDMQFGVPSVHKFPVNFKGTQFWIHITLLESSAFIWVGSGRLGLEDLQVAMPTRFDAMPITTSLIGDDSISCSIAQMLSKKLKMPLFLSVNEALDHDGSLFIQKKIIAALAIARSRAGTKTD